MRVPSGLTAADMQAGLEVVGDRVREETVDGVRYWATDTPGGDAEPRTEPDDVLLIQAYDEYTDEPFPSGPDYWYQLLPGTYRPVAVFPRRTQLGQEFTLNEGDSNSTDFDFAAPGEPSLRAKHEPAPAGTNSDLLGRSSPETPLASISSSLIGSVARVAPSTVDTARSSTAAQIFQRPWYLNQADG